MKPKKEEVASEAVEIKREVSSHQDLQDTNHEMVTNPKLDALSLETLRKTSKDKESITKALSEIGQYEYDIKKRKAAIHAFMDKTYTDEQQVFDAVTKEWGQNSQIDLSTGEITQLKQ